MTKKILLSIALLFSTASLFAQSGSSLFGALRARHIGPAVTSGRITAIDAVNDKPEVIFVGTASGGVWKSVSGGAEFRPVFDEHTQSVGALAIDQNNPDIVWVGTGECNVRNSVSVGDGVYKTTDGGTTWKHLGLKNSERIAKIIVHPANSDIVYVAVLGHLWNANEERGVYKTADGGKTWNRILYIDENTGAADLSIDPQKPDVLYAAMWGFRRYPYFFDSGFGGKSALYKTTDGGNTWNTAHNGLPQETLGRLAIAVAPSNGNVVYLTVECKSKDKRGLYLSTDAGANWEKVNNEFGVTVRPFYFSTMNVDPKNDSIVYKTGLNLIVSENRGKGFRSMPGSVHSDIHAVWINPNNTKHVILGSDGGVYESFDRGRSFKMFMNLPVSQFYHISVDDEIPFNVYGGLQDNGSWFAPSQKSGGVTNADWKSTLGGDGFWSFRHPTDKDIVFSEYQGGNIVRYNKKSGMAQQIKPYPVGTENKYRFNWNTPIHLSPTDPDRMYFGSQFLFMSNDKGDSWKIISPDLSTNDPAKLRQKESGGLTIDNSTAENHCTIYAIGESPKDGNVIWAGTDDGNLHITTDAGRNWINAVGNISGLPKNTWVSYVEPGRFDRLTAFVTFDGHRTGDMKPYLFKTADGGKTWKNLITDQVEGYAFCIRQDLVNPDLLFLGTEFGLFISVDGGANWARFENNLPKVAVHDIAIHPRDHALVLGTHGRGAVIIDDITPLRQISPEVLAKPVHFFKTSPTILRDPGAGGGWFGGQGQFVGANPSSAAKIVYYMSKRHTFGKMYVEVWKDGQLLRTLPAGKSAGINVVEMPTAMEKPKSAPTNNRMALFGSLFGPNFPAGEYQVKLVKGNDTYESAFTLANDPTSLYTASERKVQHETTLKLYHLTEQLAYLYDVLADVEKQAKELAPKTKGKVKTATDKLAAKAQKEKDGLVFMGGDGYVDEDEALREELSDIYRQISSFPGKPTGTQLQLTTKMEQAIGELEKRVESMLQTEVVALNTMLTKANLGAVTYKTFEAFMSEETKAGDAASGFSEEWLHLLFR
ncbi:MAG: hypothetical protein KF852_15595 [Saprospiraceae bacterium]|nr:hypothetical protein [Saprospiraceae bacterium]